MAPSRPFTAPIFSAQLEWWRCRQPSHGASSLRASQRPAVAGEASSFSGLPQALAFSRLVLAVARWGRWSPRSSLHLPLFCLTRSPDSAGPVLPALRIFIRTCRPREATAGHLPHAHCLAVLRLAFPLSAGGLQQTCSAFQFFLWNCPLPLRM